MYNHTTIFTKSRSRFTIAGPRVGLESENGITG